MRDVNGASGGVGGLGFDESGGGLDDMLWEVEGGDEWGRCGW